MIVGDLLDVERRIIFGGRPAGFEEIEEPVEPAGRTALGGRVETVTHESFLPLKSEAKGPRERPRSPPGPVSAAGRSESGCRRNHFKRVVGVRRKAALKGGTPPPAQGSQMPQLILIRHGQSRWNLENRFTGWWDVDVTEKGVAEAIAAGELMKAKGIAPDTCFTRSEEHTSELQSLMRISYAVFCLKKKKQSNV